MEAGKGQVVYYQSYCKGKRYGDKYQERIKENGKLTTPLV